MSPLFPSGLVVSWYGGVSKGRPQIWSKCDADVSGEFGSVCKRTDGLSLPRRCHGARCVQTAASSGLQLPVQAHDFEGGGGDFLVHHKHEGGGQNRLEQLGLQAFIQTTDPVLPAKKR